MTDNVIGLEADEAERLLCERGLSVLRAEYACARGADGADSARVIRVRDLGNNNIEITVARFKTSV